MKRDAPRGTNERDQSATRSVVQSFVAALSSRLNTADRARWMGLIRGSNDRFTHRTGRPRVSAMSRLITDAGYHFSPRDSMSFVPSANITAETERSALSRLLTTDTASDARLPLR